MGGSIICKLKGHNEYKLRPVGNHDFVMGIRCLRRSCGYKVFFEGPFIRNPEDVAKFEAYLKNSERPPSYKELQEFCADMRAMLETATAHAKGERARG